MYTTATACLLEHLPLVPILSFTEGTKGQRRLNLPSWVPDFGEPIYESFSTMGLAPSYGASRCARTGPQPRRTVGNTLHLAAAPLYDTIAETSLPLDLRTPLAMLIDCIKIDQKANAEYSNGQNSFEALWRTMIAN